MALQVSSYASQAQTASVNPFQQRGEEQDKRAEQKNSDLARAETRVQGSSAAESQKSALVQSAAREREEETGSSRNQQRGSVVDLSV
jgi:hypothetical protein